MYFTIVYHPSSYNCLIVEEMANAVHLHNSSGQDNQRLEADQFEHLGLVVLLTLKESPLKLERISVHLANLLELIHYCLDLLRSDGEEGVIGDLEAIYLDWWAIEGDLYNHISIELVVQLDEDFRARV